MLLIRSAGHAFCVVVALSGATAFAQQLTQQPAQPAEAAPAPVQTEPQRQPGFLENIGRWMDETGAGMRKSFNETWRGMSNMSAASESAARGTADAAATVARGAADATRGTVDALGRLGTTRIVSGRERCAIAPNGAPDCRVAAETMCKAKGFTTGNSLDYQTAENCPAQAYLNGRKPLAGECPIEHVVTRAMCQ